VAVAISLLIVVSQTAASYTTSRSLRPATQAGVNNLSNVVAQQRAFEPATVVSLIVHTTIESLGC